jgi:hypothetical protein
MHPEDFCSLHEVMACHKESTDATYMLLTMLVKQLAELQVQIKSLSAQFGCHIHDDNRHLRQPEKYKASNSLI